MEVVAKVQEPMLTNLEYIQGSPIHRVPDELHALMGVVLAMPIAVNNKNTPKAPKTAPKPSPKPAPKATVPVPVPAPRTRKRAFLYIVADTLGWGQTNLPALMLIGHTDSKGNVAQWGVPGGLQDRNDQGNLMTTAVREFAEEVLGQKNAQQSIVQAVKVALESIADVAVLSFTPEMMTVMVRVPSAEMFETDMMGKVFGRAATATQKASVYLSRETKGVTWVTLDAINKAVISQKHLPSGQTLVKSKSLKQYIVTRTYTIGRVSKQTNTWEASASITAIMKLFNFKFW